MSVPAESTASSEDPGLWKKVFLAGCGTKFLGKKRDQFSKNQITSMNIVRLLEQELDKLQKTPDIDRHQFSEKITFILGASRIHEAAVSLLLEDVIEFTAKLDELLLSCPSKKKSSKSKKAKRTKENPTENPIEDLDIDLESILSWALVENFDIEVELERGLKTDRNLLNEIDISYVSVELPPFGDEIHLQRDLHRDDNYNKDREVEIPDAGTSYEAPERSPRQTPSTLPDRRATRDGSLSVTPKRRTDGPHDETPTKRQKKSQGHADPSGKGISRNLFGSDKPAGSSISAGETMMQPPNQQEVQPFDDDFPNQDFQEESHPSIRHSNIGGVEGLPQDQEPEDLPAPGSSQNVEQLPDVSLANDMPLGDLNDQSLIPPRRRRAKIIADKKTMLPKPSIMINEKGLDKITKLHTKPMELVVRIDKPVADLFSLPATTSWRRGRPCTWGKPLMKLYSKMASPILRPSCEETHESSDPRDDHVDNEPRLSEWHEDNPAILEDQDKPAEDIGDSNEHAKKLMPPPPNHPMVSRPSDKQPAGLRTPDKSLEQSDRPPSLPSSPRQQLSPQKSPHTLSGQSIRGSLAVSPRTPRRPTIHITPASDGQGHADLPNGSAAMSPSTASTRERSSLMGEHEFYKFLEYLWLEEFQRTSSNRVALERLIPKQDTRITFHRYFTYLQRFQVEGKLTMTQEVIWGDVSIAKGIE